MSPQTLLASLAGGALIGLAACALLLFNGRLAGISGILAGVIIPKPGEWAWRAWFLAGLVIAGLVAARLSPRLIEEAKASRVAVVIAGLLVGFGTRLGSGCTSGHGVSGLGLLSKRSLVATLTFIAAGVAAVFVTRHLLGGAR